MIHNQHGSLLCEDFKVLATVLALTQSTSGWVSQWSGRFLGITGWDPVTCWHPPIFLYWIGVYSTINSSKIIGNFHALLNFNRLYLKLNQFICNQLPNLPDHRVLPIHCPPLPFMLTTIEEVPYFEHAIQSLFKHMSFWYPLLEPHQPTYSWPLKNGCPHWKP